MEEGVEFWTPESDPVAKSAFVTAALRSVLPSLPKIFLDTGVGVGSGESALAETSDTDACAVILGQSCWPYWITSEAKIDCKQQTSQYG